MKLHAGKKLMLFLTIAITFAQTVAGPEDKATGENQGKLARLKKAVKQVWQKDKVKVGAGAALGAGIVILIEVTL